jgi:hypothetical protein
VPNLSDIPGKSLIGATTKRARVVVAAAAGGALAVGGVVARRLLGHGGEKDDQATKDASATDIGETAGASSADKVVPIGKEKAPPKPKPAKPKAAKAKPKAAPKPGSGKAKPPKPKPAAPKPKPAAEEPKPAAEKSGSGVEPGDRSHDKGPHQALNNPVGEPDETEYPDPYETRPDPRDPVDPDGVPFGEEAHPPVGAESTSEPPLEDDPEHPEGGRPPRRENLDQ